MGRLVFVLVALALGGTGGEGDAANQASAPREAGQTASAARALAELLVGPEPFGRDRLAKQTEQRLLNTHAAWRGAPCDPSLPACIDAARKVAHEVAPKQVAAVRRGLVELYAGRLREAMSETEIRAATAQLKASNAQALTKGLQALLTVDDKYFQQLMMAIGGSLGDAGKGATDAFYDRTEGLPRRKDRFAPPPPPAPPSPPDR